MGGLTLRADELFTKNFLKFVEAEGGGALKPVRPEDRLRIAAFNALFKDAIATKFIFLKDERRVPDMGVAVAHNVNDKGHGIVASTTGFMIVEKDFRADFISWYDALDLMDHFKKEVRPTFWGWVKCGAAFWFLHVSVDLIGHSIETQNRLGAFSYFKDFGQAFGAGFQMLAGVVLFLITAPSSIWAFGHMLGPKKLFFGDENRWWAGAWFLNRDKLFDCLKRGALTWEKAHTPTSP